MLVRMSIVLVLALPWTVLALDRARLAQTPQSRSKLILEKLMGQWHLQYRLAFCSWPGSNEFTDWSAYQQIVSPDTVIANATWRSKTGYCTTVTTRKTYTGESRFVVKDSIGDVISSESYNVATDYKTFNIVWRCGERGIDGKTCDQPWVAVSTRERNPTPYCLGIVRTILRALWDLSLNEMTKISHMNGCLDPNKPTLY